MPFNIATTGLNAAATDLRVIGNNVANVGTTGFKKSRAEFADIYISRCHATTGSGVKVNSVTQLFQQGAVEFTGNRLDAAIAGDGFFTLQDNNGRQVYSRDGGFQVDREGFIVNNQNLRVLGFPPQGQGFLGDNFNVGQVQPLQIPTAALAPNATQNVMGELNLNATHFLEPEDPAGGNFAPFAFDIENPASYNFSTSLTVYDSLGVAHTATVYFRREIAADEDGNPVDAGGDPFTDDVGFRTWEVYLGIDGAVDGAGDLVEPVQLPDLVFDANGRLPQGAGIINDFDFGNNIFSELTGAFNTDGDNEWRIDLSRVTQFGSPFSVTQLNQDGYAAGDLADISVDKSGTIVAQYTNGQNQALGRLALANFQNPQGLTQLGDNLWAESFASGQVTLGEAGTGNFGSIQSSSLESSNVDLTEELVKLITAQRNYQANAQVISAADTVTQTIINIR